MARSWRMWKLQLLTSLLTWGIMVSSLSIITPRSRTCLDGGIHDPEISTGSIGRPRTRLADPSHIWFPSYLDWDGVCVVPSNPWLNQRIEEISRSHPMTGVDQRDRKSAGRLRISEPWIQIPRPVRIFRRCREGNTTGPTPKLEEHRTVLPSPQTDLDKRYIGFVPRGSDLIHSRAVPHIPNPCSNRRSRMPWSTTSKAEQRNFSGIQR